MPGTQRWKRWIVGAAVVVVMLGALSAAAGKGVVSAPQTPPVVVRVEYGDSLWTIAREWGDPRQDVRAVVAAIRWENGVDPGALRPGTALVIPARWVRRSE